MPEKSEAQEIKEGYPSPVDEVAHEELESMLYAAKAEIESFHDLKEQRGTPIPALFNQFYKFVQNPSSVSVETFKRMVDTDDTIGSGVDFLTTCLAGRLGRYQHKSAEITEWVNDRLAEIEGGFMNVVKEMLSASWVGFSVSEKVWGNTENGFIPKKIVSLPPSTIMFETDRLGAITNDGILQYQRNYNPALFTSGSAYLFGFVSLSGSAGAVGRPDAYAKLGDLPFPLRTANTYSYLSIRIPKMKCIHYAFDAQGKFGNPYGRSLLRRCFKYYVTKDAILQMMATALDRKGTPLMVVFADHNKTLIDSGKLEQGQSARDKRIGIRADQAAANTFKNIHNDSVVILPGKKGETYDLEFVNTSPNTSDFITALDFCNKSIMRALLIPSLIFTNGDGTGSYALGQEHAKTFDKILDGWLEGLKQTLVQQLVKELLGYNFPKSVWQKDGFGDFDKRQMTFDEVQKEMEVYEKAVNIGIIDQTDINDLNKMRDALGFEAKNKIIEKPGPFGEEPKETPEEQP